MVANILKKIFPRRRPEIGAYAPVSDWDKLETLAYTLLKEVEGVQHLHSTFNFQFVYLFYGMNPEVEEFSYREVMALVGHQRYYDGRILLGFSENEIEKNRKRLEEIEALFLFFKEEIEPTGASIWDLSEEERAKQKQRLEEVYAYIKKGSK